MPFVSVAKTDEIPAGSGKVVTVDGTEVAVFNIDGNFHAIDNTCKHRGGPLAEGTIEGTMVTCPWHGWEYDVTDGRCETNPGAASTCFNVRVEGDDVQIEQG